MTQDELFTEAERAVHDANVIARNSFSLRSPLTIIAKPDGSPVTEADTQISDFIEVRLAERFPNTPFISEETSDAMPLSSIGTWVLDPIDATANFAIGNPHFSISLAYVESGESSIGIVSAPLEKKLYRGRRGYGSDLNGKPIDTKNLFTLRGARILLDPGSHPETIAAHARLATAFENAGAIVESRNCASLDICSVASGEVDAFIHRGLKIWDIAAAVCIAHEAKAKVTDLQGNMKDISNPGIIVSGPELHTLITRLVQETLDE